MATSAASAAVVYSTGFEPSTYAPGSLSGQDGWTVVDTGTNGAVPWQVQAPAGGALGGSQEAVNTGAPNDDRQVHAFAAQTGTLYLSFTFQAPTVASGTQGDNFFSAVLSYSGNINNALGYRVNGGQHAAHTRNTSSNTVGSGSFVALDTTYTIVAKASKSTPSGNYDMVDIAVNPGATEPTTWTVSTTGDTGTSVLSSIVFFSGGSANAPFRFDNLAVGTSFADVTAVPEPATAGLVLCGAMLLGLRRRTSL
jgi:hypothetical protein